METDTKSTIQKEDHTEEVSSPEATAIPSSEVVDLETRIAPVVNKVAMFGIKLSIKVLRVPFSYLQLTFRWLKDRSTPVFDDVKADVISVFEHGCKKETAFAKDLFETQIKARVDAHVAIHTASMEWLKTQVEAFLSDEPVELPDFVKIQDWFEEQRWQNQSETGPDEQRINAVVEDASKVKSEELAPDLAEDLAQAEPMAEDEESITIEDEAPVAVLDPPVDPDPLGDDEMSIPEDPTPVQANVGAKRRTSRKKVEPSLSSLIREEAGKS